MYSRCNEADQKPVGIEVDSDAGGVEASNSADDTAEQISGITADVRTDAKADQVYRGEESVDAESISKS